MQEGIDELEVAEGVARARQWLNRLEPNIVLDMTSGFTSDDLFVLAHAVAEQKPAVSGLPISNSTAASYFTLGKQSG